MNVELIAALVGIASAFLGGLQFLLSRRQAGLQKLVDTSLVPVTTRLAVIEAKLDVFWRNVALDAARILHHPEPTRARVDELLDRFTGGILDDRGAAELRGYLETIRDWEPGKDAPFTIIQGEQPAAVMLLHTLTYFRETER